MTFAECRRTKTHQHEENLLGKCKHMHIICVCLYSCGTQPLLRHNKDTQGRSRCLETEHSWKVLTWFNSYGVSTNKNHWAREDLFCKCAHMHIISTYLYSCGAQDTPAMQRRHPGDIQTPWDGKFATIQKNAKGRLMDHWLRKNLQKNQTIPPRKLCICLHFQKSVSRAQCVFVYWTSI